MFRQGVVAFLRCTYKKDGKSMNSRLKFHETTGNPLMKMSSGHYFLAFRGASEREHNLILLVKVMGARWREKLYKKRLDIIFA